MVKYSLPPGFLNVNKPSGLTAHDVVNRLRKLAGIKQIGHAGTLDPMASGVLPVAIGRACRLLRFLPDDKVYLASILFGRKTDTDDIEGKIIATSCHLPASPDISTALADFVGDIEQVPPLYSAIHVEGKRLYELARQGKTPAFLPVRKVHIYSIEEIDYRRDTVSVPEAASCPSSCTDTPGTLLELRIHCASGTYIRSIARDLGDRLGSAACLAALKRESHGYQGTSGDVGATWQMGKVAKPKFAVVAHDVGDTRFKADSADTATVVQKESLSAAFALSPEINRSAAFHFVLQGNDLTENSTSMEKKMRVGMELTLGAQNAHRPVFGLRAGYASAGASYGMNFDLGMLEFAASSYAVDIGTANNTVIERRYSATFAANIGEF